METTWFSPGLVYAHAINMMPFSPASELFVVPEWVEEEWPVAKADLENGNVTYGDQWKGFIYLARATIDPQGALTDAMLIAEWDVGMTLTNALWWIFTRPAR